MCFAENLEINEFLSLKIGTQITNSGIISSCYFINLNKFYSGKMHRRLQHVFNLYPADTYYGNLNTAKQGYDFPVSIHKNDILQTSITTCT